MARGQPVQDIYNCIELHGTAFSRQGWLYEGKADLLAFETVFSFLLVDKKALQVLVKQNVNMAKKAEHSDQAIYCIYSSKDSEQVTWIATSLMREPGVLMDEWFKF